MAWITYWLVISTTFAAAGFAIWKGGQAVRLGGLLRLATVAMSIPAQRLLRMTGDSYGQWLTYYDTATSFVMAVCFLFVAFRYNNLWLGAAMVLQGSELYIDNLYLDGTVHAVNDYHVFENLVTTGIAASLCLGTLTDIRQRRRTASEARTPGSKAGLAPSATATAAI